MSEYFPQMELLGRINTLTESNRQLRESVEAVEMENKRLSNENDKLREQLSASEMSDLHDKLKANRQKAMSDWSQLNHQVVGGEVFPMADHEKIESLKAEVVKLREELEKVKAHNHELAEAGAKVSACLSDSLKLITRFRSALAAAKEALETCDWQTGWGADKGSCTYDSGKVRNALARIAECEKD